MHIVWCSGLLGPTPNNNAWARMLGTAYVIPSLTFPFALLLVIKHAEVTLFFGRLVCMGITIACKQIRCVHKEHSRCREDTCSAAKRHVNQQSKHEEQIAMQAQDHLLIICSTPTGTGGTQQHPHDSTAWHPRLWPLSGSNDIHS